MKNDLLSSKIQRTLQDDVSDRKLVAFHQPKIDSWVRDARRQQRLLILVLQPALRCRRVVKLKDDKTLLESVGFYLS